MCISDYSFTADMTTEDIRVISSQDYCYLRQGFTIFLRSIKLIDKDEHINMVFEYLSLRTFIYNTVVMNSYYGRHSLSLMSKYLMKSLLIPTHYD